MEDYLKVESEKCGVLAFVGKSSVVFYVAFKKKYAMETMNSGPITERRTGVTWAVCLGAHELKIKLWETTE